MSVEEELRNETLKWLGRIEEKIKNVEAANEKGQEFMRNIEAYISDSRYFLGINDLVRAFECVVWAWAWLEIGIEMNLLRGEI
jgi:hypothetical protein